MSPMKVLLVDDEPQILRALTWTLGDQGYDIYTATDAFGALEVLDQERIDLVISDQGMPGGNGLDLLKRVKLRYPWVMRMILTGQPVVALARRAYEEAGAYRVLSKPWEPAHLRKLIRTAHQKLELQSNRETLRRTLLSRDAARQGTHDDSPGVGRVRRDEDGRLVFNDEVSSDGDGSSEEDS